jgi:predicted site-specific integrase-resolvase
VGKGKGKDERDKIQAAEVTMNAVLYARVSSREQEREGYSISASRPKKHV